MNSTENIPFQRRVLSTGAKRKETVIELVHQRDYTSHNIGESYGAILK